MMDSFEERSKDFPLGSVSLERWGEEIYIVDVGFKYGISISYRHASPQEATDHYEQVLENGGPSVVEFAMEAAYLELWQPDDMWMEDGERYEAAALALTSKQREMATHFYFDAEMPFMEALEAARLVLHESVWNSAGSPRDRKL